MKSHTDTPGGAPGVKIINDPVHGFIEVPRGLVLALIDHPWVQRLRRIRQMGLSDTVFPGAVHTRFSHALGALHLVLQAVRSLREKGVEISAEEAEATSVAILLHDLGHGPFSHALESVLVAGTHHETMTRLLFERLNREFDGRLALALDIFLGHYPKPFLHELVSSQLDLDRLDYLIRDSFFAGVAEGVVGVNRLIKTLAVHAGHLVVEQKGIYSVERFLVARRLMYWQVYLHKTAVSAEKTLVKALQRARDLQAAGTALPGPPDLLYFLARPAGVLPSDDELVARFVRLGDQDIWLALQQWCSHPDSVLADLADRALNRRPFKIRFRTAPLTTEELAALRGRFQQEMNLSEAEVKYYVFGGNVSNLGYRDTATPEEAPIRILMHDGRLLDLLAATDIPSLAALTERVTKHYVCTPAY